MQPALHPPPGSQPPFRPAQIGVKPYELELSFFAVVILSGVYIGYEILAEPAGGHPFGRGLGIVGAIFMVMTETLYSLRKRTGWFNWAGPVRYWLSAHIFMGIVGPFMVLMHTGLQFRGLAGVSFLLTLVVVASGFIGRYLYTALPRTLTGGSVSPTVLARRLIEVQREVKAIATRVPTRVSDIIIAYSADEKMAHGFRSVIARRWWLRHYRRRLRRSLIQAGPVSTPYQNEIDKVLTERWLLSQQLEAMETVRSWLRLWHIFHVPLGLTLFFSVGIHITATLFFR